MGNLFASLISTATSLNAYDKSLATIQNNVANASTPGFVKQRLNVIPRRFDPLRGLAGGVESGGLISARDGYSERNVWRQTQMLGRYGQQAADLAQIEPSFAITDGAGVPSAINQFFNAVSSWSINPNDQVARQVVLDRASATARTFNANAAALGEAKSSADRQIASVVDRINSLSQRVHDLNVERRSDRGKAEDPSLDAQLYASLEELAQYADFNVISEPDGSIQLLFGGQTPLVIGDRVLKLRADFSTPEPRILGEDDADITGQVTGGQLLGLMDTRNNLIPSYLNDLNRLAEAFADNVNQVLGGGLDANGSPPVKDLFTYDITTGSAATLQVTDMTTTELAAASQGAPGGNANVLALNSLATAQTIDNVNFTQFYGRLGARVGEDLNSSRNQEQLQENMVTQARQLRAERTGVSLDEEAARLVEAQRAYQANAQLFQTLNELTDALLSLMN
ncbi:MAG: flagellar hook-associated protein FlgK [Acidobacteria bacterium]|nr:flagellar hook-associated protein FlgK [Acidobacteriota bacterium]